MRLSVSRDADGKTGLHELPVEDILFFESYKNKDMIILHTHEEKFFTPGSLKYWVEVLKASRQEFELVDRNIAIHLTKIKHLDKLFRIAYFEEGARKGAKSCTVSITNVPIVMRYLQ